MLSSKRMGVYEAETHHAKEIYELGYPYSINHSLPLPEMCSKKCGLGSKRHPAKAVESFGFGLTSLPSSSLY